MESYLLVDLLRGLSVTESHSCHVFQDGHLYCAVPSVQQCHQGAWVHRPVHNGWPDAFKHPHKETLGVRWAGKKWQQNGYRQSCCQIIIYNPWFFSVGIFFISLFLLASSFDARHLFFCSWPQIGSWWFRWCSCYDNGDNRCEANRLFPWAANCLNKEQFPALKKSDI